VLFQNVLYICNTENEIIITQNTTIMKTSESKKQVNTYAIYDCMGRLTDVRYYASNKAEAMKLFKADTVNYRKYGYFGKLSRIYNGGVYGSSGRIY